MKNEKTFRLERDLEGAAGRLAEAAGWFHRKYKGPGRRSHPDRLFAKWERKPFWIEFKLPGNEPTELQWLEIQAMHVAGLCVYWTDNLNEFKEILSAHEGPAWFD